MEPQGGLDARKLTPGKDYKCTSIYNLVLTETIKGLAQVLWCTKTFSISRRQYEE